jgi:hypothetical protein
MQHIAAAWQQQMVCLTPNPRVYGLLADKQRMADWSHAEFFNNLLDPTATSRLQQAIPHTSYFMHTPKRPYGPNVNKRYLNRQPAMPVEAFM